MLLAVDIGNSNITVGGYDGDRLHFVSRINTDITRTDDQYATELKNAMSLYGVSPDDVTGAVIGSVVPNLTGALCMSILRLCGIRALTVSPGAKTGLNIKIDNPAQLGANLVAEAVAALSKYDPPCIIYDFGTATTIACIDRNRSYIGGTICAGISISLDALNSRTAQLPYVSMDTPKSVFGTNTVSSIQSGLIFGTAAMIDGITDRMLEELGSDASLVATGGLAGLAVPHCRHDITIDDNLVMDGLRLIYYKNAK